MSLQLFAKWWICVQVIEETIDRLATLTSNDIGEGHSSLSSCHWQSVCEVALQLRGVSHMNSVLQHLFLLALRHPSPDVRHSILQQFTDTQVDAYTGKYTKLWINARISYIYFELDWDWATDVDRQVSITAVWVPASAMGELSTIIRAWTCMSGARCMSHDPSAITQRSPYSHWSATLGKRPITDQLFTDWPRTMLCVWGWRLYMLQVRACVENGAVARTVMTMLHSLCLQFSLTNGLLAVLLWLPQTLMCALRGSLTPWHTLYPCHTQPLVNWLQASCAGINKLLACHTCKVNVV